MKTNSKLKLAINFVLLFVLLAVLSSCSDNPQEEEVNTQEIAEIVGATLANESQGMVAQMEASADATEQADEGGQGARTEQDDLCGQEFSKEFSVSSPENQAVFYDYSIDYDYTFECNQFLVPTSMSFAVTQSGEVDAPRFESDNSSSGDWMVSGLELSSTEYSFDGNYDRDGDHASKVGEQNSYTFDLSVAFNGVKMNKGNYVISQGTGAFSISGLGTVGAQFSVNGTMEFLGNQQVLVTVNEESYIVDVRTGDVTPV